MPAISQVPEPPGGGVFRLGGWNEVGYTLNANSPSTDSNFPVGFNNRSDTVQLNQLYLYSEALVGSADDTYFLTRLDVLYGSDAVFVEVPGLERHENNRRKWNSAEDSNGLALPQFYGEVGDAILRRTLLASGAFLCAFELRRRAGARKLFLFALLCVHGFAKNLFGALIRFNPCESETFYLGYTQGVNNLISDPARWGILWGVASRSDDRQTIYSLMFHAGNDISASHYPERRGGRAS